MLEGPEEGSIRIETCCPNTIINIINFFFDILLTVHLSIFMSVFNQLDAQNLFHNKFYFMPLHVSSTCAHHQEVKIALHSLWYHHTYRWPSCARCTKFFALPNCTRRPPIGVTIPEAV